MIIPQKGAFKERRATYCNSSRIISYEINPAFLTVTKRYKSRENEGEKVCRSYTIEVQGSKLKAGFRGQVLGVEVHFLVRYNLII